MVQSLLKLKRVSTPMVAPRCHCNQRYKMRRHYNPPYHSRQMVLVMIIGAAYRQLQRRRSLITASLLQCQVQLIFDILKPAILGGHPGNIESRTARMVPTTPLHQWTTTSQCHPPHILNPDHQAIHGDMTLTAHIPLALSQT